MKIESTIQVFEGRTPLNKLSIEIHVKFPVRELCFAPRVTIFWMFWMHLPREWNLNFSKNDHFWYNSSRDFKIRAFEQRHHYFEPTCTSPSHFRPGPEVEGLVSTQNRILTFCDNLSHDQAILFHIYYKILSSLETSHKSTAKCHTHDFVFYRN